MFTWGSKYLFGVTAASLLGAVVYGLITGGGLIGVLSIGYKGGVGEHAGYAVLLALAAATAGLGVLNVIVRDADVEAGGEGGALAIGTPRKAAYWGPMAAFGVACLVVGVSVSRAFFALGAAVLAVVALEWAVQAWSDRATGDEAVNAAMRDRLIAPLEVPLMAVLGIAVVVLGVSRVLLAVSKTGSVIVAAVVAAVIFLLANFMARAKLSRSAITGIVAVIVVAVLAGGILGAAKGERKFGHETGHEQEQESGAAGQGEGQ